MSRWGSWGKRIVLLAAVATMLYLPACGGRGGSSGIGSYDGMRRAMGRGSLVVNSEPSNARCFVNEKFVGRTPVSMGMRRGTVRVRLERPGYQSADEWPTIVPGQRVELNIQMQPEE